LNLLMNEVQALGRKSPLKLLILPTEMGKPVKVKAERGQVAGPGVASSCHDRYSSLKIGKVPRDYLVFTIMRNHIRRLVSGKFHVDSLR
jgi:hypothetical protein